MISWTQAVTEYQVNQVHSSSIDSLEYVFFATDVNESGNALI